MYSFFFQQVSKVLPSSGDFWATDWSSVLASFLINIAFDHWGDEIMDTHSHYRSSQKVAEDAFLMGG